jgi:hypothetical protein
MKTTLSQLIHDCVKGIDNQEFSKLREEFKPGNTAKWQEKNQLALNALEERLNEMIDARVAKALEGIKP